MRAIPIQDGAKTPVLPTQETIQSGAYQSLLRPFYRQIRRRFDERQTGSLFSNKSTYHLTIESILRSATPEQRRP